MTIRQSFPTDLTTGLPIIDTRVLGLGDVARDTAGGPRLGIVPAHLNPIVTGTASMTYSVGAFNAVTSRSGTGIEKVANDGAVSVVTTAAPSSNSRIDIIYVRPRFTLNADGSSTPELGVVQGAAAAVPVAPPLPAGALELARATVAAGATSTNGGSAAIIQTFLYTSGSGGTVLVRNSIELDAWTPADGAVAYNLADGAVYIRRGGAWRRIIPAYGTASAATSTAGTVSVDHGLGVAPTAVMLQPRASSSQDGNSRIFRPIIWGNPTATSFEVRFVREDTNQWVSDAQAVFFYWQAIP